MRFSIPVMRNCVLGFMLAATALQAAGQNPDPRKLAEQVDAACKAVRAVSYRGKVFGVGALADRMPVITGRFVGRQVSQDVRQEFYELKTGPESTLKIHDVLAYDGKQAVRIDHANRHHTVIESPALLQQAQMMFLMLEFFHESPFSDEINAESCEYEGVKEVGGVRCHVVHVRYDAQQEARWYWGVDDHLPYRVERISEVDGVSAARVLELHDLKINPDIDDALFTPAPPDGYTERNPGQRVAGPTRPTRLLAGDEAPDFELARADGLPWKLSNNRGNAVVLLFWNTWTRPCLPALEQFQKLEREFDGQPVKFMLVNSLEDGSTNVADWLRQREITSANLVYGDQVASNYRVRVMPTHVVIDKQGKIVDVLVGPISHGLAEAITRAIQ